VSDVIVAGGGVIGCAIAWELVRRGAVVTVVERSIPGHGATRAAAGMLSPLREPGPFRDLAATSFSRYPDFIDRLAAATGENFDFDCSGKLRIALTIEALAELDALAAVGEPFGAERIDGRAALDLEPSINPGVLGGLLVRAAGRVDNRRLGEATWTAARAAGARLVAGSVREVRAAGRPSRTSGVRLEDGTLLPGASVVIAAGAWSATIHGLPYPLPVRPVRGQMLALAAVGPAAPRLDRTVETNGCYLVPRRDGRVLVGATVEEVAFAPGPTLTGISALAAAAVEAVPGLAELPLVETWAGFRPGTPDALPVLGEDPELTGLFYATGHFRNGILLAPVTAQAIADLVTGVASTIDLAPFGVERFRDESDDRRGSARASDAGRSVEAAPPAPVPSAGARAPRRVQNAPASVAVPACDLCGAPMIDRHCKLICTGCGYMRDCSDP
jgi:glycine oxidase